MLPRSFMALRGFALLALATAGCVAAPREDNALADQGFTAADSRLVTFEFDASLVAPIAGDTADKQIKTQLLFLVGLLNNDQSGPQLPKASITNVQIVPAAGGESTVTYHARVPVAFRKEGDLPEVYDLVLPKRVSPSGIKAFRREYGTTCTNDPEATTVENVWYHFRPDDCTFADGDVVRVQARVTAEPVEPRLTYPEYDKIWQDHTLKVVAVFGKDQPGNRSPDDAGTDWYNSFQKTVRDTLAAYSPTLAPGRLGDRPGPKTTDITIEATLPSGDRVVVNALLVDRLETAPAAFEARFEALTADADVVMYSGHAGIGKNIGSLAKRGAYRPGQYVIELANGCDSYSYFDETLAGRRTGLNEDDPNGTKYMDSIVNANPGISGNALTQALFEAVLTGRDHPRSYLEILGAVDQTQRAVVLGDEDNAFRANANANDAPAASSPADDSAPSP